MSFSIVEVDNIDTISTGELKVVLSQPTTPYGATSVKICDYLSSKDVQIRNYTVTDTKNLIIQSLCSGSAASNGGSVCELWYDPDGVENANSELICIQYTNGSNATASVLDTYGPGDNIKRIRLIMKPVLTSTRSIFFCWKGYEE